METHVGFILDMSGSMGVIKDATKNGTVDYMKTLKKEAPKARFSLTIFDTIFEQWVEDTPIDALKPAKVVEPYEPRGMTALHDAVGVTVTQMEKRVKARDKAVVVIMTDGAENSSQEWDLKKVARLIARLEKTGRWTFVYLGANVDAFAEAQQLGIAVGNVAHYSPNRGSTSSVLTSTARATGQHVNSAQAATSTFYQDAGETADHRDEDEKKVKSKS